MTSDPRNESSEPGSPPTSPPAPPPASARPLPPVSPRQKRLLFAGVVVVLLMLGAGVTLRHYLKPAAAEIPLVPPGRMSPTVAELLERQRSRVQAAPDSAHAWGVYGMCLLQHERPREALDCFEQASALEPEAPRWLFYAGTILELTDLNAARQHFETALQHETQYVPLMLRTASVLMRLNQTAAARDLFERVLAVDASAAEAYVQLLRLARQDGDVAAADRLLNEATNNNALCSEFLTELAGVRMLNGETAAAKEALARAADAPPAAAFVADPWMDEVRAFDASGAVASAEADALRQQGQFQQAVNSLASLDRRFPDRSRAALNHALLLSELGRNEEAQQELQTLAVRFPDDPLIQFHLAFTFFADNDLTSAERILKEAIRLKPDFAPALAALGDLYEKTERSQEAVTCYRQALLATPEDLPLHVALIDLLLRMQRQDEARAHLVEAMELASGSPTMTDPALLERLNQLQQSLQDSTDSVDPL